MLPKIGSLLLLGSVICPFLSAKFCSRSYVNGKWMTDGDCGGAKSMSQIMKELQLKAEDEKKRTKEQRSAADRKKPRIADKKWTVFQRGKYGNVDFYRGWDDYVNGFGNRDGDFWLGLKPLHEMTKEGNMELEIKMITRTDGIYRVAKYSDFSIGPGSDKYRLHVSGYSGNASGDALSRHDNLQFSTYDADHDYWVGDCASRLEGAWWYKNCGLSNLNGDFNKTKGRLGIWWQGSNVDDTNHLRYSEMKLRKRS